jgi:putative ABC transport system substrate-binding protein
MNARRRALAGLLVLAAAPLGAQPKRLYRIGMLESVPIAANNANLVEFHKGMKELGYAEGADYVIVYRASEGRAERFGPLAEEMVRQKVEIFLTRGTLATLAAARAGSVPIVATALADPEETGLVASLDAPGGRVTGLASNAAELGPKRLELLKALAPGMTRVGVLVNPANPASLASWKSVEAAAAAMRLRTAMVDAAKREALGTAIEAAARDGVDGLLVGIATLSAADQARVIEAAAARRLPAIYAERQSVEAGGLASYGAAFGNLYYRAAAYIDKILKGARPAELPMGRPTKFEFVVNRRTARSLELAIPPDLLLRSDDVVE